MTPDAQVVARRLRKIIRAKDMRPAQVERGLIARSVPCSQGSIYRWLNGEHTPRRDVIEALAKVLGVNADILTGGHELIWSGRADGQIAGECAACKRTYALDGGRYSDEDITRFQLMHWGIPA
jgi:transcriptional regulator with XRE-family HTH domain